MLICASVIVEKLEKSNVMMEESIRAIEQKIAEVNKKIALAATPTKQSTHRVEAE